MSPPAPQARRGMTVSAARFRALWYDPGLRIVDIAALLGVTERAVRFRALRRGLPHRRAVAQPDGARPKICDPDFAAKWRDGVGTQDLARGYGVGRLTVIRHARRVGLSTRGPGWRPMITLSAWSERRLRDRMAVVAARETALERAPRMGRVAACV